MTINPLPPSAPNPPANPAPPGATGGHQCYRLAQRSVHTEARCTGGPRASTGPASTLAERRQVDRRFLDAVDLERVVNHVVDEATDRTQAQPGTGRR